jgi:hypothetical protein
MIALEPEPTNQTISLLVNLAGWARFIVVSPQ